MSDKTKVKRLKDRGTYDKKTVHSILDEAFIAHVGFVKDGYPLVLPMGYARDGEYLLLHGSITNAMLKNMKARHTSNCNTKYTVPVIPSWRLDLNILCVIPLNCIYSYSQMKLEVQDKHLSGISSKAVAILLMQ